MCTVLHVFARLLCPQRSVVSVFSVLAFLVVFLVVKPVPAWGQIALGADIERVSFSYAAARREFLLWSPSVERRSFPAIVVLHGGGGSAHSALASTRLLDMARRHDAVLVFPDSIRGIWNDGSTTLRTRVDDVGFLSEVVSRLVREHQVDPQQVIFVGLSTGGRMVQRFVCERSNLLQAQVLVASSLPAQLLGHCHPPTGLSTMMVNGTADAFVNFEGGEPLVADMFRQLGRTVEENAVSVEDTFAFWTDRLRCTGTRKDMLDIRIADGTQVEHIERSCPERRARLFVVHGGGHTCPGSPNVFGDRPHSFVGVSSRNLDVNAEIVRFLGWDVLP